MRAPLAAPAVSAPVAVARYPARPYQANVAVRRRSGTTCESAACSMARNGPTSLPVGEMTPMIPATMSSATTSVPANASPAMTTSRLPAMSTRRRPRRSARVVSHNDTSVSPSRVRVRIAPIASGSSPTAARYRTRTTARKP